MKYFTFGKETAPLVVILHGGGTSYRGAEPTARLLGEQFRVVLVAYDGFNPTEPDTEFKSVMDEAKRVGTTSWNTIRGGSTCSTASPSAAGSSWRC